MTTLEFTPRGPGLWEFHLSRDIRYDIKKARGGHTVDRVEKGKGVERIYDDAQKLAEAKTIVINDASRLLPSQEICA